MDAKELDNFLSEIIKISPQDPNLPKPKESILQKLIDERKGHRQVLLSFVLWMTVASFYLLSGIVCVQMIVRSMGVSDFEVLSNKGMEILTVGVFGQIIGVVYLIAKSLWSAKEFDVLNEKTKD